MTHISINFACLMSLALITAGCSTNSTIQPVQPISTTPVSAEQLIAPKFIEPNIDMAINKTYEFTVPLQQQYTKNDCISYQTSVKGLAHDYYQIIPVSSLQAFKSTNLASEARIVEKYLTASQAQSVDEFGCWRIQGKNESEEDQLYSAEPIFTVLLKSGNAVVVNKKGKPQSEVIIKYFNYRGFGSIIYYINGQTFIYRSWYVS